MRLLPALYTLYRRLPSQLFRAPLTRLYRWYIHLYSDKTLTTLVDGYRFELDLREAIDSAIYFKGAFEPDTRSAIRKFCKPGMNVLDIGANTGYHALFFAHLCRPGRVVAFEPMPWASARLRHNLSLNRLDNVAVEGIALGDVDGAVQKASFRSSWTLNGGSAPASLDETLIAFRTLDSYVAESGLQSVDLMKIDVDGYEARVIRGAFETLRKYHPIIIMELGVYTTKWYGDNLEDLLKILLDLKYVLYSEADMTHFSSPLAVISAIPSDGTINIICSADPIPQ